MRHRDRGNTTGLSTTGPSTSPSQFTARPWRLWCPTGALRSPRATARDAWAARSAISHASAAGAANRSSTPLSAPRPSRRSSPQPPHDFPPWEVVHRHSGRWAAGGTSNRIHDATCDAARDAAGRDPTAAAGAVDPRTVRRATGVAAAGREALGSAVGDSGDGAFRTGLLRSREARGPAGTGDLRTVRRVRGPARPSFPPPPPSRRPSASGRSCGRDCASGRRPRQR